MSRADPFKKEHGYEPTNCSKLDSFQANGDPYVAAQDFIKQDPARNCCTVESSKRVSKWQLPPKAEVHLRRVSDNITFYYNSSKMSQS